MWQIKFQNEFLDLVPGQSPEVTRNSPLFFIDLQENSTPLTIAYTDKNSRLLGHIFFEQTRKARKKIDVELYQNNSYSFNATMVVESAGMNNRHNGTGNASGYLLFGISHFYSTIKDKLLSQLALGGLRDFSYTSDDPTDGTLGYWQHFNDIYDFSDDYVMVPYINDANTVDDPEYQTADGWGNKYDGTKITTDQPVIPFVKMQYVLEQIFAEAGWKLDTTGLNDTEWQRLLLFSNYSISTFDYTWSGSAFVGSAKSSIIVDLSKAMPPGVTCSTFLFELCKRYLWAPIFDLGTSTCRLVALKEVANKPAKDWTKYASPSSNSDFNIDEKIFAFKNTFSDDDQNISSPDLSTYPLIGFAATKELLPSLTYLNDNSLYYVFNENKWYKTVYDDTSHTTDWAPFGDNIYDDDPGNATDTFETLVTTLPIRFKQMENGKYGLFPAVNYQKNAKWAIRTIIYHGMVAQVDDVGAPVGFLYPYGSSTNMPPAGTPLLAWSNVFTHNNFINDYGIVAYWAATWMQLISLTEEITRNFSLPLHELAKYTWDDIINIQNIPYLIKSIVQTLEQPGELFTIQTKLQPLKIVASTPVDSGGGDTSTDAHFTGYTLITFTSTSWEATAFVKGEAGATITFTVAITKTNPAAFFKANNLEYFDGQTFTITLDGSGNGSYNVKLGGLTLSPPHQVIAVHSTITATTVGAIGTPDVQLYSKTAG
jgi:hypothetical protein